MTPAACTAAPTSDAFVQNLAGYVECQSQNLGEAAFQGWAGGVLLPALLTSALTIFVGLIGFRLISGRLYDLRDCVASSLRAALVITFVTSWASYDALIYRPALQGPAEIAAVILQAAHLPLLTVSETAESLDKAYTEIEARTAKSPILVRTAPEAAGATTPSPLPPSPNPDPKPPMSTAGAILLVSVVGGLLAPRVATAILLAIGPLVIVAALFDSTIGLLEGWFRAMIGAVLATTGASIVTSIEVNFIDATVQAATPEGTAYLAASGLMVVAPLFALAILSSLIGSWVLALGFRLPRRFSQGRPPQVLAAGEKRVAASAAPRASQTDVEPTLRRAQGVANAVAVQAHVEAARHQQTPQLAGAGSLRAHPSSPLRPNDLGARAPVALGYSFRRTPVVRRSSNRTSR